MNRVAHEDNAGTWEEQLLAGGVARGGEGARPAGGKGRGLGGVHDLIHRQGLAGDEEQSQGNRNTFHNVLDQAGKQIIHFHSIYILVKDFLGVGLKVYSSAS
jgi:hypothetical protein